VRLFDAGISRSASASAARAFNAQDRLRSRCRLWSWLRLGASGSRAFNDQDQLRSQYCLRSRCL